MLARLTLLTLLTAAAVLARAQDPPAKAGRVYATTVVGLNNTFKRDADGRRAKQWIGRVVAVTGTVRGVAAADDGGQTLTLDGLPPTPADPYGCVVPFPAGHPLLEAVKVLAAGATVQVRGTIDGVTKSAFSLTSPTSVSAVAGPAAKAPTPPAPKTPATAFEGKMTIRPVPQAELLKNTAADWTKALLINGIAAQQAKGQVIELTGAVRSNVRAADGGRTVELFGWDAHGGKVRVVLPFPADSPDLPKVRGLGVFDEVTVRATFDGRESGSQDFKFSKPALVADRSGPPPDYAHPVQTADAVALAKELLADPAALAKLKGQVVAVTGTVSMAGPLTGPHGTPAGLRLGDRFGFNPPAAECAVEDNQLDAVWELSTGARVRVVGVVGFPDDFTPQFENGKFVDRYRVLALGKCRVALLEPNLIPRLSAAELVAAYKADVDKAGEKYGTSMAWKPLILTGEAAAVNAYPRGVEVVLRAAGGEQVILSLPPDAAGRIKPGQAVRAKVNCGGTFNPLHMPIRVSGFLLSEPKTPLPVIK